MQPTKTKLYQKRDFGEVLNATFTFLRNNAKSYLSIHLAISGIFVALYVLFTAFATTEVFNESFLAQQQGNLNNFSIMNVLANILQALSTLSIALVTFAYLKKYHESESGEVHLAEVWSLFSKYFLPVLGLSFLWGMALVLGFVLLIIPGIYLMVRWSMVLPLAIIDDKPVMDTFGKSNDLVKGSSWPVFGMLIVLAIISYIISLAITLPAGIIFGVDAFMQFSDPDNLDVNRLFGWKFVLVMIFGAIGSMAGQLVYYVGLAFQYFSLIEAKESRGLLDDIEAAGQKPTDESNQGSY